jgi:hypothetical protein
MGELTHFGEPMRDVHHRRSSVGGGSNVLEK